LNEIKPHQIYCAGDFADPHGTHKVCFDVVIEALKRIVPRTTHNSRLPDLRLLALAAQRCLAEWDITEIKWLYPSPDQVVGIFIHQSQKTVCLQEAMIGVLAVRRT
jgi:glucosamine-6-phosphate deaminase